MYIYDEILNKYAEFLGYENKIKNNEKYLREERDKLEKIIMLNDMLCYIKKHNYNVVLMICHDKGSDYITKDRSNSKAMSSDVWKIKYISKNKLPCICFEIDIKNNTYKEILISDIVEILFA